MDLIKRMYETNDIQLELGKPFVYFNDLDDTDKLWKFLRNVHCYSTDLSYEEVDYNLVEIFNKLGFMDSDSICLHNMRIGNSRYDINKEGYCLFNFSLNSLEYENDNTIGYYSSNELFTSGERYAIYPGVKLSSGNESLYYTVGTGPYIRQFDIKINENMVLTREYSDKEVFFMFDCGDKIFTIRIKKPLSKVVTDNYILDNELELIEYLRDLSSYDMVDIYNNLCEISLGNDISKYLEIDLCESVKTHSGWKNINSLTIKNGNLDCAVRTMGDRTVTLHGNGNWNYTLSDEKVTFRINSGKNLRYGIEANSDRVMNDYMDNLMKYDVSIAKREVEDTKKIVKALGIGVKKRR